MYERKDRWSVGQWMSTNPVTVTPDTLARSAFFTMRRHGFRHLPVVEGGTLVGIVTDRDLRRPDLTDEPEGWHDFYALDDTYQVRDVMTEQPHTVHSRDTVEQALHLLVAGKFGALPVLDKQEQLIGIITVDDLLRAFQAVLAEQGERLRTTR